MALETIVFQQDPFITTYGCEDFYTTNDSGSVHGNKSSILSTHFERSYHHQQHNNNNIIIDQYNINNNMSHPPCSMVQPNFKDASPVDQDQEMYTTPDNGLMFTGATSGKRNKRRRVMKKASKNKEEVEHQRMTHIAVERNRRRQMNHYLALLRSMMPPSYAQRGDQGSIVGGAINYVKELEQHLQYLETQKLKIKRSDGHDQSDSLYVCNFFTFPQYKTSSSQTESSPAEADIEVTMVESHANLKVLSTRQPKQLFKMISGLQSLGLTVLHLNITTVDHRVFYSFNLKVEDDCQLTTVKDIATAVHEMMVMIKQEAILSL